MNNATMAGLVGTNVVAYGNTVNYAGEGDQTLHYDASSAVDNLTLTITNEEGDVVRTVELGGAEAGEGSYTWDGTDKDGNQMPEGEYTFSFSGTDSEGNDILVDEIMHGTITEMDYSTGVPLPSVDGILISLGDIMRLTTEAEPTEPAES